MCEYMKRNIHKIYLKHFKRYGVGEMGLFWFLTSLFLLAASSFARHQESEQGLNHSTLHLSLYHVQRHDSPRSEHLFGTNSISTPLKAATREKGNYYININLGTPPKRYAVMVDTGSSFSWVKCQSNFNASKSSAYKKLPCSTTECKSVEGATQNVYSCPSPNECHYSATYVDATSSSGYLIRDTLSLTQSETLPGFVLGCGQDNQGFSSEFAGLVGMARNELSMISQLSARYGHDFSYCLPTARGGRVGSLSIGKDSLKRSSYKFTPMLTISKDRSLYGLSLKAIVVAGRPLGVAEARYKAAPTIIDSGTVVTRLPTLVYASLRDEFKKFMSPKNKTILANLSSDEFLDTCYKGSLKEMSSYVPKIRMVFQGGAELNLAPQNVLIEGHGTVCLAFADYSDNGGTAIIGNIQLQTYSVAYDVSNKRIGFAAGGCS